MKAPSKYKALLDQSKKASYILDYVLGDESEESVAEKLDQSPVAEELSRAPLVSHESGRKKSRVLFITRDVSVLEKDSISQLHFLNLRSVFDEVHIIVLSQSWQAKKAVERLSTNLWTYTTSGKYWWSQIFVAQSIANNQLKFADGFRPDVIVALDPFESGLAGFLIAEKYDRAFQVHVTEDFFDPEFKKRDVHNGWRLYIASFVLKQAQSMRTATNAIKTKIKKKFRHIKDISLLPRHYNISAIISAAETTTIKDIFPQYAFVALFVGKLDHDSTLFRALDASRAILHSKSIGLVVVGHGPTKKESEKRAEILGITQQVVFEKDESRLISYLKSADILICTDTTEASEEVVIQAAAAGLPLLLAKTEFRGDLFTDGESAFLCDKEDTIDFSQKLVKFLNTNSLRTQFATNARDIIKTRLHEDPESYKFAYRDSIERVFSDAKSEIETKPKSDPMSETEIASTTK